MKAALVIMAAGLGSRYGGNKQVDGVGPQGEMLMEYSIYDAVRAGFTKVVFIIKPEMREKAAAERVFERLFHNISQITIAEMKGKQIEISLGACFCEVSEEVSFDQLYRKADRAMYQSKKKQGYSASIYEEWMKSN